MKYSQNTFLFLVYSQMSSGSENLAKNSAQNECWLLLCVTQSHRQDCVTHHFSFLCCSQGRVETFIMEAMWFLKQHHWSSKSLPFSSEFLPWPLNTVIHPDFMNLLHYVL